MVMAKTPRRRADRAAKPKPTKLHEVSRPTPWGATKQAADCFEQLRKLKNRVFELEQQLAATGTVDVSWHPTGTEIAALGAVVALPMFQVEKLGILDAFADVCRVFAKLDQWNRSRGMAATKAIQAAAPDVGDRIYMQWMGRWRAADVTGSAHVGLTFLARSPNIGEHELLVRDEGKTWKWP